MGVLRGSFRIGRMTIQWQKRRRWHAVITYRTDAGSLDDEIDLNELSDLHDHVESGPHFDTIISIVVTRGESLDGDLTVEEASKLLITEEEADMLFAYVERNTKPGEHT